MSRRIFDFDPPDRFVAGAVGQPGQRTFYLQARWAGNLVTVALEKVQVAVLADRMATLLGELRRRGMSIPAEPPPGAQGALVLEQPIAEAFRVGTLMLAWDTKVEEIIVEARELIDGDEGEGEAAEAEAVEEIDDDDPDGPDLLRVRITPTAALGFIEQALRVVSAGRPPCPLCGRPLDPQGHFCPRRNGGYAN